MIFIKIINLVRAMPGRVFRRLLIFTLPAGLFLFLPEIAVSGKEKETEKREELIKQIEQDLEREKEKYEKFDLKQKGILEQLAEMEKVITEKRITIQKIRDEINAGKTDLTDHRQRLKGLDQSLSGMEGLLAERLAAYYKYSKRGYWKILAMSDGLDQLNRNMKYLRAVMAADREAMENMARKHSSYRREVSLVEEKLNAVAELEEAENSRLLSLNEELENKVILLARIHKEKEFHETAVRELESAADNLQNKILVMDRKKEPEDVLLKGFTKKKGGLPLPLTGRILSRKEIGDRSFDALRGIYIEAPFGADIRAVFPGRVDYSGQLKGYGQVVVLNHGERFFTIYAFLLQRDRQEGEIVSEGDLLGQVGESGLVAGPALYFEIREGEKALDPLQWVKVN